MMLTAVVRRAGPTDAPAIVGILDAVAKENPWLLAVPGVRRPEQLLPALQNPDAATSYWVAPATGLPLGVIEIMHSPIPALHHTAIFGMAVVAPARRRGYGRALVEAAEGWARERGVQKVTLMCAAANTPALTLYSRCGYREEGRQHRQLRVRGEWVDALWLAHWLEGERGDES